TVTITINGTNDAPVVRAAEATVSEEGLPGGIPDGVGTPSDTTDLATDSGTITITDVDGEAHTVTLGDPGAVLTADGAAVTWNGVGTDTLIGSANGAEVIRIVIDNSGSWTVTLSQAVDHATIGAEDITTFSVPVSVSDGTATTGTTLSITIEDDSPVATADTDSVTEGGLLDSGTDSVLDNDGFGADGQGSITGVRAAGGDTTSDVAGGVGNPIAG